MNRVVGTTGAQRCDIDCIEARNQLTQQRGSALISRYGCVGVIAGTTGQPVFSRPDPVHLPMRTSYLMAPSAVCGRPRQAEPNRHVGEVRSSMRFRRDSRGARNTVTKRPMFLSAARTRRAPRHAGASAITALPCVFRARLRLGAFARVRRLNSSPRATAHIDPGAVDARSTPRTGVCFAPTDRRRSPE